MSAARPSLRERFEDPGSFLTVVELVVGLFTVGAFGTTARVVTFTAVDATLSQVPVSPFTV